LNVKMASSSGQQMPEIDMSKDFAKLSDTEKHFVKKLEALNLARAKETKSVWKKNRWTAAFFGGLALSIYGYTMYSMRQEHFLDDFDTVPGQKEETKA